ncbi:hypothetical protein ACHAPA_012324 [Fusarium lateritium]
MLTRTRAHRKDIEVFYTRVIDNKLKMTTKDPIDYILRGRQFGRFIADHYKPDENDFGLTTEDVNWIRTHCPMDERKHGEGEYPTKWLTSPQSLTSTRTHWRKEMARLDGLQTEGRKQ